MKIILSPQRRNDTIAVTKKGDVLTINGNKYDFSALPDGGELPATAVDCEWIVSDIVRQNGELQFTLILPHTFDASDAARFPEPIVNPANGELVLPQ